MIQMIQSEYSLMKDRNWTITLFTQLLPNLTKVKLAHHSVKSIDKNFINSEVHQQVIHRQCNPSTRNPSTIVYGFLVGKIDCLNCNEWNWHIQWNEHLALELSYDLGLGCSHLFYISIDYDSSYPWIRLTYLHLIGVRPVQAYWWKTNVTISLPSPTSDNAMNMSIGISCRWITIVDGFPFDELLVDELHCWWTSCWYTSGGLIWLLSAQLSARTKILKCQNQCYTGWFFLTAPPRP